MVFPVVGGTQDTGAYEIDNSLRFNDGDNPNLTFTPSSAVTSERKTFTISCWVKRGSNLGTTGFMWEMGGNDNANERIIARFDANNRLNVNDSSTAFRIPNRVFRDPSAWYHIVVAFDTTDSTADNRVKVYINGVQETSFLTSNNPGQNDTKGFSHNSEHTIGRSNIDNGSPFDGYMTEFHAVGGSQLDATSFGEFDDNGVWIPKKYTGSHGTNGFYLEFKQTGTSQNSSGIGADTSGNDNHFAVSNLAAIDITTDTCTNNFITWNALNHTGNSLQEGNTFTETRNSSDYDAGAMGNIGLTRGKWYWELKITAVGSHTYAGIINIGNRFDMADEDYDTTSGGTDGYPIYDYMELGKRGSNTGSGRSETGVVQATYGDGDILNFALDLDNNKIHYGKNGTYGESSDPANNTNGIAISDGVYYTPVVVGYGSGDIHANFGQPAFSISSGNADANGYGNFEYAVPSGYFSICTKNLAEYG